MAIRRFGQICCILEPHINLVYSPNRRVWFWGLTAVWLAVVSSGLGAVWAYENRPGVAANAPSRWPAASALVPADGRPTLLFVAHPQCTCTRASIEELAEVLARSPQPPKTYVLFLRPGSRARWNKPISGEASALPNVTVLRDDDGVEARWFGSKRRTNAAHDRDGALVFHGGNTGARAHAGENAASSHCRAPDRGVADRHATSVFGCLPSRPATEMSASTPLTVDRRTAELLRVAA